MKEWCHWMKTLNKERQIAKNEHGPQGKIKEHTEEKGKSRRGWKLQWIINNYKRERGRERGSKQNIPKDGISWLLLGKNRHRTNEVSFCSCKDYIIRWYYRAGFIYGNEFVTVLLPITETILCFQVEKRHQELGHHTQWEHRRLSQRSLGNKWPWRATGRNFSNSLPSKPKVSASFWTLLICPLKISKSQLVLCWARLGVECSNENNNPLFACAKWIFL